MASKEGAIRLATNADVPRLLEIERESATAAHWAELDYRNAFTSQSPRRLILVAEPDQRVEGFLVARCAVAAEWEIENVVVAKDARREGLGAALVSFVLEQIRTETSDPKQPGMVHLEVRESNLAARHLYEKFGFLLDSRRTAYYRHPDEDAILYRFMFQQHSRT